MNRYHDPAKPHHREHGFQNNYVEFQPKSLSELLRWRRQALRDRLPRPPLAPTPRVAPELDWLHANARAGQAMAPCFTWIGHATVLVQMGGLTVLTDPMFSLRASPVPFAGPRRHTPPGIELPQLPRVDLVLVSHNHYDHLDAPSVDALNRQPGGPPLFVVPLGVKPWLHGRRIRNTVELDWWDRHTVPGAHGEVEIALVPAQHWSSRSPRDAMATLWGGFAVIAPDCHLLYTGDTGYSRDFADIRRHFSDRQAPEQGGGFDIALIPIGAYAPRWFMKSQHVDIEEALRIHADVGAKRSLGIHWGVFELSDEALDDPPRKLAEVRDAQGIPEEHFFAVAVGETRRLASRLG
ncbi:MBL fold metallo-hydrolase [Variovorax sp. Sphag1AA]|uniref:MBL fold metallo-hydrolase n=1 Tax=Variovorax sp. Sphag1AA TaxID=2587027 RepID=UPI00160CA515|nr:MBL fold metallo-hydrolase [Variovorax sp. Sphag1AA]MBB3175781.1 N-acyl-phosphatidylethanolamine-hydrolyzing phospholipase D [Variovorax sp. Sphag1AA]